MNDQNLRRFVALLIDFLLVSIAYSVLINLVPETLMSLEATGIKVRFVLAPDAFLLLGFLYFIACDLLNEGESLGKDIMGLQIRGSKGDLLSLRNRIYRTLLKMVSLIFWPVALVVFFWKERNLTLQDYGVKSTVALRRKTLSAP